MLIRIIVLAVLMSPLAGCGGDEKKESPVPPVGDKFDKSKEVKGKKGDGMS